ncbi:uncharacterized protein LOC110822632 [Carica papaya]|uniref:uncharacterized protein LOC110822632 n=1 Tax=Carica papaya TaxID=3649 RepID=UPI000B8D0CA6|nr:uncharacterized protein LOC110822632 [Carica papaya]
MPSPNSSRFLLLLLIATVLSESSSIHIALADQQSSGSKGTTKSVANRALLSFKEVSGGTNVTFECSRSGPCVPCLYSEKNDEKYRCSETGYRIPLRCVEIQDDKNANGRKTVNGRSDLETSLDGTKPHAELHDAERLLAVKLRSLLEDSSTSRGGSQAYITYRSCIPAVNEEKLSVIGFEGIMLGLLLISGSVVYVRRKRTVAAAGVVPGRIQTNSRF